MTFHLMGGDRRQTLLATYLQERGFDATLSYPGGAPQWDADALILPLPATKNQLHLHTPRCQETISLQEIFRSFRGNRIFGGLLPTDAPACAIDYYQAEEVLLPNAALTAEGALALAIERTPFMLSGSPALILGGGRIGQFLAAKLSALGAQVWVGARRSETTALCRSFGWNSALYEDLPYRRFRLVFNTVPARILDDERLALLPKGALLIELASAPGGFDPDRAVAHHLKICYAPGLPGQYAPETAAKIIGDYILKEMDCR